MRASSGGPRGRDDGLPGPPGVGEGPPLFVPDALNDRLWHIPFNRVNDDLIIDMVAAENAERATAKLTMPALEQARDEPLELLSSFLEPYRTALG